MSKWDLYEISYDRLWVQKVSLKPTRENIINKLKSLQLPSLHLLDMSCGTGQLLDDIRSECPELTSIGVEPSRLGQTAQKKGHDVIEASMASLKLDQKFGCICCTHAFPYYDKPEQAIAAFAEHLLTDGYLLIAHAETKSLYDRLMLAIVKLTTSVANYPKPEQMRAYLSTHFEVCETVKINAWYIPSITLYIAKKKEPNTL